jgi:hypothetical protein
MTAVYGAKTGNPPTYSAGDKICYPNNYTKQNDDGLIKQRQLLHRADKYKMLV